MGLLGRHSTSWMMLPPFIQKKYQILVFQLRFLDIPQFWTVVYLYDGVSKPIYPECFSGIIPIMYDNNI